MDLDTYRQLQAQARRLMHHRQDAEDLVHDTLLAALRAGRHDLPWLSGVLRNQAAMAARSAQRRRRREALHAASDATVDGVDGTAPPGSGPDRSLLAALPPAPRRVAVLLLHGLDGAEIRWILGIADTALRQRLTRIRKALAALPQDQQAALRDGQDAPRRRRALDLKTGLLRRALKAALAVGHGLGTHDPDGHLVVVHRRAHGTPAGGN